MKKRLIGVIGTLLLTVSLLGGCAYGHDAPVLGSEAVQELCGTEEDRWDRPSATTESSSEDTPAEDTSADYESCFADVPAYAGSPSVVMNDNVPYYDEEFEKAFSSGALEWYSDLDDFSRPQVAFACLGLETMPAEGEERGEIGMIKPAGWHTVKYPDVIKDLYLYNRCHLIGWQLGAENANELNLMTGTRYLNVDGMLPYENLVADYIRDTGNHVLYRVTPHYVGEELITRGLLMEAKSVEDDECIFCVYCYNVQPGVEIDYMSGDSWLAGYYPENSTENTPVEESSEETSNETVVEESVNECAFVLNNNSMKIHKPTCSSVSDISENNIEYTDKTYEELIAEGYSPCGRCHPNGN